MSAVKRFILTFLISVVCGYIHAANIVWGGGSIHYYAPGANWGYSEGVQMYEWWLDVGAYDSIFAFMDVQTGVNSADFTFLLKPDNVRFKRMNLGDVVDASSMADVEMPTETLHVDCYNTVFIAFEELTYADSLTSIKVYGWAEFGFSEIGGLMPVAGAIDLDGGPMIVGGGALIPEPSAALLLLVGGAALTLRRRRRSP